MKLIWQWESCKRNSSFAGLFFISSLYVSRYWFSNLKFYTKINEGQQNQGLVASVILTVYFEEPIIKLLAKSNKPHIDNQISASCDD